MKKLFRKCLVLTFTLCLLLCSSVSVQAATEKSNGTNMARVLKYYKKGQYSKALMSNRKLSKTSKEACVKKMSSKMKKAYRKIVKRWPVSHDIFSDDSYLWGYYLTDIDNDKKAELLVKVGTCEADVKVLIYKYKNGKASRIGSFYAGHTTLCAYPNHKGIILYWGHMGCESLSLVTVKNKKVTQTSYGSRDLNKRGTWLSLRCSLDSHVSYDSNYNRILDLSDLQ